MKSLIFSLFVSFFSLPVFGSLDGGPIIDVRSCNDVPVLHNGRVMPMDTYANFRFGDLDDIIRNMPEDFRPIPVLHHGQNTWLSPAKARMVEFQDEEMMAAVEAWEAASQAIKDGDQAAFDKAISVHRQFIVRRAGKEIDFGKLGGEVKRNQLGLVRYAGWGLIVVTLFGRFFHQRKIRKDAGLIALFIALWGIGVFDLCWHALIAGRPPVYHTFECLYLLGVLAGLCGLVGFAITRSRPLLYAAGSVIGGAFFVGLLFIVIARIVSGELLDSMTVVSGLFAASGYWVGFSAVLIFACSLVAIAAVYGLETVRETEDVRPFRHLQVLWGLSFAAAVIAGLLSVLWSERALGVSYSGMDVQRLALVVLICSGVMTAGVRRMGQSKKWWIAGGLVGCLLPSLIVIQTIWMGLVAPLLGAL